MNTCRSRIHIRLTREAMLLVILNVLIWSHATANALAYVAAASSGTI